MRRGAAGRTSHNACHATRLCAGRASRAVNAKVLALLACVEQGFEIQHVDGAAQGGLRIRLARGGEARWISFEHFELPAVLQECSSVGLAK